MLSKAVTASLVVTGLFTQACSSDPATAPGSASSAGQSSGVGGASAGSAGQPTANGGAGAGTSGASAGTGGANAGTGGANAGTGGANAGTGGATSLLDVAQALDGLRIDDPCAGTPMTTNGAVCPHVALTEAGGSKLSKSVTIGGTAGTTYDVTLRIRGVVEPSNIVGGTRTDSGTFEYENLSWRKVPFTVGGTVTQADYSQWHLAVGSPAADYYLNDYQRAGHYIFELDYEVTVPIAANGKVTLDGTDSNERMIVNYEKYAPDGIAGSMNFGQFVQIDVLAVTRR